MLKYIIRAVFYFSVFVPMFPSESNEPSLYTIVQDACISWVVLYYSISIRQWL